MRGSLRRRSKHTWLLTLEFGYVKDPSTGKSKRIQKYVTFRGTKREAQDRLTDLLHDARQGTFVEPSKRRVGEWLDEWADKAIKPPRRTPRSYATYKSVIALHLKPSLGHLRLQGLAPLDVEAMLAEKSTLAPATLEKILMVLNGALKAAVRSQLIARNVATLVVNRPKTPEGHPTVVENCWTADEASAFLRKATAAGPRQAAFYGLALDSGCRKSELAGLLWSDVNLTQGRILVRRQLLSGGRSPVFTPTKNNWSRTIDIAPQTASLLRAHKRHQAALKMRHRQEFHDHGLVFCKDQSGRRHNTIGDPLSVNNLGQREFARLVASAGVKLITLHGLRHTCATLLLAAGVPPHVVQMRLGHKKVQTTLSFYAHVLPGQQREAALQLSAQLYGF